MKEKLLIVGTFRASALESVYLHNFRKMGLSPHTFEVHSGFHNRYGNSITGKLAHKLALSSIRKNINKALLKFDHELMPQVVLIFKGADLTHNTISKLRSRGRYLINYNPDHPYFFEKDNTESGNIHSSINLYHLYITYSRRIAKKLATGYQVESLCIPFGFDDRLSSSRVSVTTSTFAFIGKWDDRRASYLKSIDPAFPLEIYGDKDWLLRSLWDPAIKRNYQREYLSGSRFTEVISQSQGVINLLRPQNLKEQSHNMRTFEVPGNQGVLLAERTEEQEEFFKEGEEAFFFDTQEELESKMAFLSQNPSSCDKTKLAAYKRSVKSNYSYYYRALDIAEAMKRAF